MQGTSYRIIRSMLGIISENGTRIPVTLPLNSTVTIAVGPVDGNLLVDVMWEGRSLMVFTEDLRERAERVNA